MEKVDNTSKFPTPRELFFNYARKYFDEMKLLFRSAKLSKKEGDWNNVIDHSLVQVAEVDVLSDILGLSDEDTLALEQSSLIHDWSKRIDMKKGDFSQEELKMAEDSFKKLSPRQDILDATSTGFSKKIIDGEASLLQMVMFYVDDITKGDTIARAQDRIDEVEARRQDLNESEEWANRLGGKYWDVEREAVKKVEKILFDKIISSGAEISLPEEIPDFIKQKVGEKFFDIKNRIENK